MYGGATIINGIGANGNTPVTKKMIVSVHTQVHTRKSVIILCGSKFGV